MIQFKQKQYSEYDAMNVLYNELRKGNRRYEIINRSSLIPILKGNNVVIERFVISTSMFGRDKYRMYLKIGAKASMPDDVRLPTITYYDEGLFKISTSINNNVPKPKLFSSSKEKMFGGNQDNNGGSLMKFDIKPYKEIEIKKEVHKLLGEALKYDKQDRSLVLEFEDVYKAIQALNILPFGFDYKIYLLNPA